LTDDEVEKLNVGDRISQGALTGTVHTVGPEFIGSGGMGRTGLNSTHGPRWRSSVSTLARGFNDGVWTLPVSPLTGKRLYHM
jgi:hypothetical protein